MTRVDATSPVGEKAQRIEHPAWCDRSLCTVKAALEEGASNAGSHLSADLKGKDLYRSGPVDMPVYMRQTIYQPHGYNVAVLVVGDMSVQLPPDSPLMWAMADEHARQKKIFSPAAMRDFRARAREYVRAAKEAW